jgi:hypothetical protein
LDCQFYALGGLRTADAGDEICGSALRGGGAFGGGCCGAGVGVGGGGGVGERGFAKGGEDTAEDGNAECTFLKSVIWLREGGGRALTAS